MLQAVGVQIRCRNATTKQDVEYNIHHACALITEHHTRNKQAQMIYILPECSSTGYDDTTFEKRETLAEKPEQGHISFDTFSALCIQLDIFISYGFVRVNDGHYFISQAVINNHGVLVSLYDKVHLFHFEEGREHDFFTNGTTQQTFHVFDCYSFKCASQICFDLRYPEPWRILALEHKCDFVIHTSFDENSLQWNTFTLTRALENQFYILSLNHAGTNLGKSFFCPPWLNDKLSHKGTDEQEGYIEGIIEKSVLQDIHREIPLRESRMLW
jgi:predicted amidohydrolase